MNHQPNVMVILTDDQGVWAMGCSGNPEIRTPNLDRIAEEGIRFENMFCVSPVCSPARASLLTGTVPSRHGVHDWIRAGNSKEDAIEYLRGLPAYSEVLAENGWCCGFSGKWHLGDSATPQKGFSHWYTHESGGGPYYTAPMYRDGVLENDPRYVTDIITDDAIEFITRCASEGTPFYSSVCYTAPHSPWIDNHPEDIVDSYDDCPFNSCPVEEEHPWSLRNTVPGGVRQNRREHLKGYFAAVTAMDLNVGRILDCLDRLGIRENTLLFFTSDNGYNCGHHGIWGKGNGTYPLNMYDSSVKVPTLISHPGHLPENTVCDALVSHYDFMPSLLEYLGLDNPYADGLPGQSFIPLLTGGEGAERENIVVFDEYGPVRMIRTREWKYVHRYPYGPNELYDLKNDPGEKENRAGDPACVEIIQKLRAEMETWFHCYTDPARDGRHEAVYGKGQLNLAGLESRGVKNYADDLE